MAWTRNRPIGLTYRDAAAAFGGYTLFATARGHHALLLDEVGRIVHSWFHPEGIQHLRILGSGNLLVHTLPPENAEGAELIGGSAGALLELDWESRVVWEYRDRFLHHDFQRLPNGNHLVIAWDKLPAEPEGSDPRRPRPRGRPPVDVGGRHQGDHPRRPRRPRVALVGPPLPRRPPDLPAREPQGMEPLQLPRDHPGRGVAAELPAHQHPRSRRPRERSREVDLGLGVLSHQHHATWLGNGHILVFDNGCHRLRAPSFSQVIELDPASGEIVWSYHGHTIVAFFSFMVGGCERLPNGNTLVTEGASGRLFEVTPKHDIVWEYVSPWILPSRFGPTPVVFRAYRLAAGDPCLAGRPLSPDRYRKLNARIASGSVLGEAEDLAPLAD